MCNVNVIVFWFIINSCVTVNYIIVFWFLIYSYYLYHSILFHDLFMCYCNTVSGHNAVTPVRLNITVTLFLFMICLNITVL